jgi:hypothetical protein
MYAILECATYIALTLIAGTLLFGACVAFLMVQEGVQLLGKSLHALVLSAGPAMRPARHPTAQGG